MADDPRARLTRQYARARAREADARAEAEGVAEALRRLDRTIGAMNEAIAVLVETRGLRKRGQEGTLGTVTPEAPNVGSKVSAAKTKHPWPFSVALHAHGSSPAQWALSQVPPQNPETVRAWLKAPGKGGRPVPRADAERIEAEFAGTDTPVPAMAKSWPNGIRETP